MPFLTVYDFLCEKATHFRRSIERGSEVRRKYSFSSDGNGNGDRDVERGTYDDSRGRRRVRGRGQLLGGRQREPRRGDGPLFAEYASEHPPSARSPLGPGVPEARAPGRFALSCERESDDYGPFARAVTINVQEPPPALDGSISSYPGSDTYELYCAGRAEARGKPLPRWMRDDELEHLRAVGKAEGWHVAASSYEFDAK